MTLNICVVDEDATLADSWATQIANNPGDFQVQALPIDRMVQCVDILELRQKQARESNGDMQGTCDLDSVDVLVIDHDLLPSLTRRGASIAYLARCYSDCGFIIVLNQYERRFNLKADYHIEAFADLHVDSTQIGNPGLWSADVQGYRPWHWPVVPDAVQALKAFAIDIQDKLDAPLFTILGLASYSHLLSGDVLEFIRPATNKQLPEQLQDKDSFTNITIDEFIDYSLGGIEGKDRVVNPVHRSLVAAARLSRWLNLGVLPRQDILIDAPHLVWRIPSVLPGDRSDLESWNAIAAGSMTIDEADPLADSLQRHKFRGANMLWRSAWLWPGIVTDETIPEIIAPWDYDDPTFLFCEDFSRFLPQSETLVYRIGIDSSFQSRRIVNAISETFLSSVGEILSSDMNPAYDFSRIQYEPPSQLTGLD